MHIVHLKCPHVQIAFLKFSSCDEALVGCIQISEPEIIEIGQSSLKMYRNNILNFQESMKILNAGTKKKSGNLLNTSRIYCHETSPTGLLSVKVTSF